MLCLAVLVHLFRVHITQKMLVVEVVLLLDGAWNHPTKTIFNVLDIYQVGHYLSLS